MVRTAQRRPDGATRNRPIPTGRIESRRARSVALALSLLGLFYLALFSSPGVSAVATLNWLFYVACYTPLKAVSVWQLPVGSVAGAMPIVIGGAVVQAPMSPLTVILFGIVFWWQFPHAIAIAWIYRDHYAQANLQVASVRDPSGKLPGVLAVVGAVVLLPISLLPVTMQYTNLIFGAVALVAGLVYLVLSVQFLRTRADQSAHHVLWASFLYLPAILFTLLGTS